MGLFKKWILFFLVTSLGAQRINFQENDQNLNMDYSSFYPFLILSHSIGTFYKLPKNPVLSPSNYGWDSQDVADPFVYVTADSIYLFYDGSDNTNYSIGYAVRDASGWFWERRKQILKPDKTWRSFHVIAPTIIPNKDLLLYNGNSTDSELGYSIGLAGKSGSWAYMSEIPLFPNTKGVWDFAGAAYQDVIFIPQQNIYKMWYSGFTGPFAQIGLMSSADGIHWKKRESPVFMSPPGVIAPEVIFDGDKYILFFTQLQINRGLYTTIKSAESHDGISWTNIKPVLKPDADWEGRKLMRPNISFFEEQVHLFYCAQNGSNWHIGEAVADASFESPGFWKSRELSNWVQSITVKYEAPLNTLIKISILDQMDEELKVLDLNTTKKRLRQNVFMSKIMVNRDMKRERILVKLSTENTVKSPIIYEISLE